MALTWRQRRQVLYYGVGSVVALVFLFALWQVFFSNQPTCSDGIINGTERGIDCGGLCARICPNDARPLVLLWDRQFLTSTSAYTAVAYVENRNVNALAKDVRYSFKLYDERGILVAERIGSIDIPPVSLIPIVETGIDIGSRTVASSDFAFIDEEIRWERNTKELPSLRVTQQNLAPGGTRLTASLVNDSVFEARNVVVIAVLFDSSGVARAASKTTISRLPRQSSESLVFTWPTATPGAVRAEISVLPSL